MTFPYEVVRVPGAQALERLAELAAANRGYPVILGDAESMSELTESFEYDGMPSVQDSMAAASQIDVAAWLAEREEEEDDYFDVEKGEWPDIPEPNNSLSCHRDILTGEHYDEVFIALIPAAEPWMVPCYLGIGAWNECPSPEEHAAMFKSWGERFGATVACITNDVIEMQVARPPATREEAMQLAKEHFVYCADIVHQGTETLEVLAASLLNARVWYFWWD